MPTVSPSRIPVKLKYLILDENGKTYKATNLSEVNRMKRVLKNQGVKFKVTKLPKGSTTWNTNPKRSRTTGTTVPAHVRINPRTGRIQVFVTPKVAEKLRGGKGLRVAGNPKLPELRRDLFKVVKTSPVGYGVKGKDGFMWLSGSGKTQATKLARQMNYEDRYRQQRSETARHL